MAVSMNCVELSSLRREFVSKRGTFLVYSVQSKIDVGEKKSKVVTRWVATMMSRISNQLRSRLCGGEDFHLLSSMCPITISGRDNSSSSIVSFFYRDVGK